MHDKQTNPNYQALSELLKRANNLEGISRLLFWDHETYMPKDAEPVRAEQLKLLAELTHGIKTGSEFEKELKALGDIKTGKVKGKGLTKSQETVVKVILQDYIREKKLPSSFVQELAQQNAKNICGWHEARKTNAFAHFLPMLTKSIALFIKKADYIGYKEHPYDALLEEYEPGITTNELDVIFGDIKREIKKLLEKVPPRKKSEINIPCTLDVQLEICHELLEDIGFEFNRGRIDVSAHPFSSSYHPYDSRMTCRNDVHTTLIEQILTTLHEAGHSFYDMGFSIKEFGTPLSQPASHGIHESQSRFWETRIGRSRAFWKYLLPKLKMRFKNSLEAISLDDFMGRLNIVQPSFIRVYADEVTYPLHIIHRYEIEKDLVAKRLAVKNLPKRWNSSFKELLGITPPDDIKGCLQDIHWSIGYFGYFPTYLLGNAYAAQMFEAFSKKNPHWEKLVEKGQFAFIRDWLHENVWQHGRRYDARELIQRISGKPLSAIPFVTYLKSKYSV